MNQTLHIGTDSRGKKFTLPLEIVTTSLAILAKKRVGKSYLAAVLAEELMSAGQPVVIVDITGAHWGLKSTADGNGAGFPVVIFGGRHADVPLEEKAGEVVARAIVEKRFSAILDFSIMSKAGMKRFLLSFMEELYRINELPIHLICDEADRYAPQKPDGDDAKLIAAMDDIVSRGGIKGIGVSLITQRSAKLNKNILTQCELLVALKIQHPLDAKSVMEWIEMHATDEAAAEMLKSLPTLPVGTGWFWWPGEGEHDIFERVKVRPRTTFDSGATPKAGAVRREPKQLAKVDVDKLGADIAATVQRAKENDPAALRAEIYRLKADLAKKPASSPAQYIEVPILRPEDIALIKRASETFESVKKAVDGRMEEVGDVSRALNSLAAQLRAKDAVPAPVRTASMMSSREIAQKHQFRPAHTPKDFAHDAGIANIEIGWGGKRRILAALAQYPDGMGARKLSILTGISASGGTWRTYLAELRGAQYVEGQSSHMRITGIGRLALGAFEPLPSGEELVQYWRQRLGDSGKRRIFDVVVAAYPSSVTYEQVSRETGIDTAGGTWRTYLAELRRLELITGKGELRACDDFFT